MTWTPAPSASRTAAGRGGSPGGAGGQAARSRPPPRPRLATLPGRAALDSRCVLQRTGGVWGAKVVGSATAAAAGDRRARHTGALQRTYLAAAVVAAEAGAGWWSPCCRCFRCCNSSCLLRSGLAWGDESNGVEFIKRQFCGRVGCDVLACCSSPPRLGPSDQLGSV